MKIHITTDNGELLQTIDGADFECSDKEIIERGDTEGGIRVHHDLATIAEDAIQNEIDAMIRRKKPI